MRLWQLPAFILVLTAHALGDRTVDPDTYQPLCREGVTAIENGKPDTALNIFLKAYAAGMPAESLYYFWADAYLRKGAYDSALALNFSIDEPSEQDFGIDLLKQRYLIYSALGWKAQADSVIDSLKTFGRYRTRRFVPTVDLRLGAGYRYANELIDTTQPWGGNDEDGQSVEKGTGYSGHVKLTWSLPWLPDDMLSAGVGVKADKPYWAGERLSDMDSASVSASAFAGLSNLLDRFSVDYTAEYRRYYDKTDNVDQTLSLAYFTALPAGTFLLNGGYGLTLAQPDSVESHNAWLMTWFGTDLSPRLRLGISISALAVFADQYTVTDNSYDILYVDDVSSPNPTYYRDSSYTEPIRQSDYLSTFHYVTSGINASRTPLKVSKTIPQTHMIGGVGIEPAIATPFGLRLTPGLRWNISYYPAPYQWYVLDEGLPDTANHFARNRADGKYYHVVSGPRIIWLADSVTQEFDGPVDNRVISRHRIDNAISGKVSLTRGFGTFGALTLSAAGAKTWSTLSGRTPVDIPDWHWSVSLNWRKVINP